MSNADNIVTDSLDTKEQADRVFTANTAADSTTSNGKDGTLGVIANITNAVVNPYCIGNDDYDVDKEEDDSEMAVWVAGALATKTGHCELEKPPTQGEKEEQLANTSSFSAGMVFKGEGNSEDPFPWTEQTPFPQDNVSAEPVARSKNLRIQNSRAQQRYRERQKNQKVNLEKELWDLRNRSAKLSKVENEKIKLECVGMLLLQRIKSQQQDIARLELNLQEAEHDRMHREHPLQESGYSILERAANEVATLQGRLMAHIHRLEQELERAQVCDNMKMSNCTKEVCGFFFELQCVLPSNPTLLEPSAPQLVQSPYNLGIGLGMPSSLSSDIQVGGSRYHPYSRHHTQYAMQSSRKTPIWIEALRHGDAHGVAAFASEEEMKHWQGVANRLSLQTQQCRQLVIQRGAAINSLEECYTKRRTFMPCIYDAINKWKMNLTSFQSVDSQLSILLSIGKEVASILDDIRKSFMLEQAELNSVNKTCLYKVLLPSEVVRFWLESLPYPPQAMALAHVYANASVFDRTLD